MKTRTILGLFVTLIYCLYISQTVFAQTEKLGIVQYTPPKGWAKTMKENIVTFSEVDEAAGKFCIITLYGVTAGTGTAQKDFTREWNNLVVKPFGGESNPKTETEAIDTWTATAGGAAVDFNGTKALAFLTVLSSSGKTISILGVFNDEAYLTKLVAFSSSLDIKKEKETIAANPAPQPQEPIPPAAPVAAAPAMHVASLVKEFENNEIRANQTWIGKRVRVYGTVNTIEIGRDENIILTFKTSISTYNMGRCFFNKSQSSRIATLNAHEVATVEGTVRGLGGGFDNSKAFLLLENCTVP